MKIVINEKQEINNLVSNEIIRLVKSNPQAVLGLATGERRLVFMRN